MIARSPMRFDSILHALRRRLAWLLCIAVLLPAAQLAATAHAMSHELGSAQSEQRGELKGDIQHCAWCLAAAATASSAPPAVVQAFAAVQLPAVAPLRIALAWPDTPPARRPSNRGPPTLLQ